MLDKDLTEKLNKPLNPKRVKHRVGGGGTQLSYIEGHDCIDTANELFGYGNWGVETIDVWQVMEKDIVKGYAAKVRLEVLDCKSIIGIGFNPLQAGRDKENGASPDSHDMAIKGAETDAMKRCFRNFGDQFGNSLYDKTLVDGQPRGDNSQQPANPTTRPATTQQPAPTVNRPAQAPTAPQQPAKPSQPVTLPTTMGTAGEMLATEQQRIAIINMAGRKGVDNIELEDQLRKLYGSNINSLTRNDAAHFIKVFQEQA